jgi:hypothetical protein
MSEAEDMINYDVNDGKLTYFDDQTWTTRDGRELKWEEMETSHLKNVFKYIDGYCTEIPILLLVELRLRKGGIL